jgi:hypothetical protein
VTKITVFILFFVTISGIVYLFANKPEAVKQNAQNVKENIQPMKITNSAFQNNTKIPSKYTCDGQDINPELSFLEVPANAKSLVLIMDDPDAPGGTFVHWVLYNMDPKTNEIKENSVPHSGVAGKNSTGKSNYFGACPPSGLHHYHFKLYALDTVLNLTNPDKATLEKEMQGHILEKAELIGIYSRI